MVDVLTAVYKIRHISVYVYLPKDLLLRFGQLQGSPEAVTLPLTPS